MRGILAFFVALKKEVFDNLCNMPEQMPAQSQVCKSGLHSPSAGPEPTFLRKHQTDILSHNHIPSRPRKLPRETAACGWHPENTGSQGTFPSGNHR